MTEPKYYIENPLVGCVFYVSLLASPQSESVCYLLKSVKSSTDTVNLSRSTLTTFRIHFDGIKFHFKHNAKLFKTPSTETGRDTETERMSHKSFSVVLLLLFIVRFAHFQCERFELRGAVADVVPLYAMAVCYLHWAVLCCECVCVWWNRSPNHRVENWDSGIVAYGRNETNSVFSFSLRSIFNPIEGLKRLSCYNNCSACISQLNKNTNKRDGDDGSGGEDN